jgi:hypothetical protein
MRRAGVLVERFEMHTPLPSTPIPRRHLTPKEKELRVIGVLREIRENPELNLDGHSAEWLMSFWALAYRCKEQVGKLLFADRPIEAREHAVEVLTAYASLKAAAMSCREDGRIAEAMQYEHHCQNYYSELPEWARW